MYINSTPSKGLVDATTFEEFAEPGTNFIRKFQFLPQDQQSIYNPLSKKKLKQKNSTLVKRLPQKLSKEIK